MKILPRELEMNKDITSPPKTGRRGSVARSPRTPGEKYEKCKVCSKELNVKSMKRHLEEIHKRILPDASIRSNCHPKNTFNNHICSPTVEVPDSHLQ